MPNVEYFRIHKQAQAVFDRPLFVQDAPKLHRWQRGYTVSERKHLLSRMLLYPSDSCPVPLRIHEVTIRDAVVVEDYCFKRAVSTKHYQETLAQCIRAIWQRDAGINFPVARVNLNIINVPQQGHGC